MGRWVPKMKHISRWGIKSLCGRIEERNWPEDYMDESTGLWKTVPYCIHCKGEEDRIEALKVEEKKRGIEKGATHKTPRVFELSKKSQKIRTHAVARNDSPLYLKSFEDYKSRQR
tara:strand:+ start:1186 stop:1530 length:345 start_codon:yes stop_codon:yes gene_type:complete